MTPQTPDFRGAAIISALTKDVETVYTSTDIDKLLPHRYPFALVDRIVELEPGKRAVGIKSVTKNEDFFNGHFPDQPVMPGVLQLEALAQLAGVVFASAEDVSDGFAYIFGSADGVIWKKPVVPGDTLVMEVEVTKIVKKFGIAKVSGSGYTDGELAVEVSEMTLVLP
jgi:3-hydroxyacyl-[acyl-carrier-protein] dehydratase